jgi:dolichol kinase
MAFLIIALPLLVLFGVLWYGAGILALRQSVKVNYTRKVIHFSIFFYPFVVNALSDHDGALQVAQAITLVAFVAVMNPFSIARNSVARTMFAASDRPEDRPNTLRWFWIQVVTGQVAASIGASLLLGFGYDDVILLIAPLAFFGDGLAEPVGVRFGTHRYRTYAVFAKGPTNTYWRTIEGSATVFVVTATVVLVGHSYFTTSELIAALVVLPVAVTVAEAIAPHTMDTPFLMLASSIGLFIAKHCF